MNIVVLNGSIVGSNTKVAMEKVVEMFTETEEDVTVTFLDLADYDLQFSDGRNFIHYHGDTKYVAETIMQANALVIGTPVFQASIPGTLKNIFDLLPVDAFRDKVVSIVTTAGSSKHYLIVEQQLKPILSYMKAYIVPTYVFIEEENILRQEIINDDIIFRLERLVEDTLMMIDVQQRIREKEEAKYDF